MPRAKGNKSERSKDWLPETLVINNKINGDSGGSDGACGLPSPRRKVLIAIILYGTIATGLWIFFFQRSFGIPGLGKQIELLEGQIELLNSEIINLETQVDRFEDQVRG